MFKEKESHIVLLTTVFFVCVIYKGDLGLNSKQPQAHIFVVIQFLKFT